MTHSILEILIKQTTKTQRINCGLSFFLFLCWCNHGERETAKITVALPHPIPPLLLSFLWVENCPSLLTNSSPPPPFYCKCEKFFDTEGTVQYLFCNSNFPAKLCPRPNSTYCLTLFVKQKHSPHPPLSVCQNLPVCELLAISRYHAGRLYRFVSSCTMALF